MSNDWIYDLETYPNVFTMAVEHAHAPITFFFEVSDFRNDSRAIVDFVHSVRNVDGRMVGFNNIGFDYPILHTLMKMGYSDAQTLYNKAQAIIGSQDEDGRWQHYVKPSDYYVPQLDLFKIHHFDNKARSTSLKALEFNMRSDNIEDLPYKPGTVLTPEQIQAANKANLEAILNDLRKAKPSSAKGVYFKAISISTTMGPGLAVDKSSVEAA